MGDASLGLYVLMNFTYIYIHEDFVFSADSSMYHSLGYGTILYIQAVMTFDMVSMFCILCE